MPSSELWIVHSKSIIIQVQPQIILILFPIIKILIYTCAWFLTVNKSVTYHPKQAKYSKNTLYIKDTFFFSTEGVYSIEKKRL